MTTRMMTIKVDDDEPESRLDHLLGTMMDEL